MIWKNPFQIKNYEQNDSDIMYLDLFNSSVLDIIDETFFETSTHFSSTPGAGKTSLFKAFSASVLQTISKKQYETIYSDLSTYMKKNGLIVGGKVKLLTCELSCARNYDMLDEMFTNGRRKQVFFALLNFRITIAFLRSICIIQDTTIAEGADKIGFVKVPDEILSELEFFKNGKVLFQWACDNERKLCKYLDGNREQELELSFIHTTMIAIKLFEPKNILFNGEHIFDKSLVIFDDIHKLSREQKKYLVDSIYVLRTKVGTWFGERIEGLTTSQIISLDGSLEREYNKSIVIDQYWSDNSKRFITMLHDIANKRVKKANLNGLEDFESCVSDELEFNEYERQSMEGVQSLKKYISNVPNALISYSEVIQYIDDLDVTIFERALYYSSLVIKLKREEYGQMQFYLGEKVGIQEFEKFYGENKKVAEYYFCNENKIPYYFGIDRIMALSSGNVEQFLYFAAGIFDRSRAVFLGSKKNRYKYKLTAKEQERYILEAVKNKWNDMFYRYSDAEDIQKFLSNIGAIGLQSRNDGRNSYNGGAYTGIGIKAEEISQATTNEKYKLFLDMLGKCVASKYLEKKSISHDGEHYVFYLNRWLCVHFGLPLPYGGWKKMNIDRAANLCLTTPDDSNQIDFFER